MLKDFAHLASLVAGAMAKSGDEVPMTASDQKELRRIMLKVPEDGDVSKLPKGDLATLNDLMKKKAGLSSASGEKSAGSMSDASKRRKEAVAESNEEDDVSSWEIEEIMPHSLPSGTTFEEWQKTVCSLPKVVKEREWKGKSYAELVNLSEKDKELQKYLSWIQARFASEYVGGVPKSEAVDLAGFLQYIDFKGKAGSGYQRKVKKDSELFRR